jgi:ATP-dependent Clp protease protease subunit
MTLEIIQLPETIGELVDNVLPDPDQISYYVLEKERIIYLDCDIEYDVMAVQRMIIRWNIEDKGKSKEERRPIRMYVHSTGGMLFYMWPLIDTMEASVTPIITINLYMAGSAAALIYLAGHKRYMMKNAKLIIHEGQSEISGDAVKVLDATESYKKQLRKMKEFIVDHTNISKSLIMKKRNNDWELDAQYCLDNGVCEKIIESLDEIL